MNYVNKYLTACMVILMSGNHAFSQANTSLSNLVSTCIHQNLKPNANNIPHPEFPTYAGKNLYGDGSIYLDDYKIINNGQSFFVRTTGYILNPFENSSLIPFRIPHHCKDASIAISESAKGKIVSVVSLAAGESQWTLEVGFTIVVIILSLCLWMELLWIRKA